MANKNEKKDNLPYEDPAIVNPEELSSFPKEKKAKPDIEAESESHLVNKKVSPVRSGRNITNTGPNTTDENGFM